MMIIIMTIVVVITCLLNSYFSISLHWAKHVTCIEFLMNVYPSVDRGDFLLRGQWIMYILTQKRQWTVLPAFQETVILWH